MKQTINVLLVDDSAFFRLKISKILQLNHPQIKIIDTASNGEEALEKIQIKKTQIDVVLMDIIMKGMNGIEAVGHIMDRFPKPVILLSGFKKKGEIAFALLELGMSAVEMGTLEFIQKPDIGKTGDMKRFEEELVRKLESISKVDFRKIFSPFQLKTLALEEKKRLFRKLRETQGRGVVYKEKLILVGASTGGPRAVQMIISMLPTKFPPLLLVQHMPSGLLVPWINRLQKSYPNLRIRAAQDGTILQPNKIYIAPEGRHCVIGRGKQINIVDGEKVNFVIPAADVTFESAAKVYGKNLLGIILTGMGQDGKEGARAIKKNGGKVIAEHESTCVIYSMPEAVINSKLADRIIPLHRIANGIRGMGWI